MYDGGKGYVETLCTSCSILYELEIALKNKIYLKGKKRK